MDERGYFEQFVGDVDEGIVGEAFIRFAAVFTQALQDNPDIAAALQQAREHVDDSTLP